MKKTNIFFALILGVIVSLSACSDDDDPVTPEEPVVPEEVPLTPEELEAIKVKELIEETTANYNSFTAKKWQLKEFVGSDDLIAASKTDGGAVAKTIVLDASQAPNFNMVLNFEDTDETSTKKVVVDINLSEEEINTKLLAYQGAVFPDFAAYDFLLIGTTNQLLAQMKRVIASPFAADELKTDDITDDETGLCKFDITFADFSNLTSEEIVLGQKKMIKGNSDKIYMNEDGTLTVETTHADYGVSKLILEEVTE